MSSVSKALNRKHKSGSFTEEDTQSMPRFDSNEFPELQSETGGDESHDNLAEKHVYGLEVGEANSDISNHKKLQSTKTANSVQKTPPFFCVRASKRARRIPKVFTPPKSNGSSIYCLCQREDTGWYLICSFQIPGCLTFYHPQCVGLSHLKSRDDGMRYSNCEDGESYMCPVCKTKSTKFDEQANTVTSLPFKGNGSESLRKEELFKNISHHRSEIPVRNVSHVRYNNGLNNQSVSSDDESASVNLVPNNTGANAARSDHNKEGSVDRLEHSSDCDFDLIREGLNDDVDIYSTACFSEEQDKECQNGEERYASEDLKTSENASYPEENDANLLFQSSGDEEWNSDNFDRLDDVSDNRSEPANSESNTNTLPVSHDTLSRMMDCPSLPSTFFIANLPRKATFLLSEDEWNKMKPSTE